MSITTPPSKILLTSTTKISLNDRFAKLAKTKPAHAEVVTSVAPVAASAGPLVSPKVRASEQNQRLALQMSTRPAVRAALQIKKKSIRQQLDVAYRNRGGSGQRPRQQPMSGRVGGAGAPMPRVNRQPVNPQANNRNANNRGFDVSRLSFNNSNNKRGLSLAQRLSRPATMNNKIRRVGARNNQRLNQSFGGRSNLNTSGRVNKRNSLGGAARLRRPNIAGGAGGPRRFKRNQQGGGGQIRNNKPNNFRKNGNKMNNRQQGGGATGGKGKPQQANKTKENLDMDIEVYMKKSKGGLDKDLDSYMQQGAAAANQQ